MTGLGMPGVSTWNFGDGFAHLFTRFRGDEPQCHRPRLRDLRQRYRRDAALEARARGHVAASGGGSLPPAKATSSPGRRATTSTTTRPGPRRARLCSRCTAQSCCRLLREGLPLPGARDRRAAVRVHDPGRPGRPGTRRALVARLLGQHIEVEPSDRRRSSSRRAPFPAGTYVVRLDQPYRNYAVDLLTPQHYPEGRRRALRRHVLVAPRALPPDVVGTADPSIRTAASRPLDVAAEPCTAASPAADAASSCATPARKACSRRATGSRSSRSRSPSAVRGRRQPTTRQAHGSSPRGPGSPRRSTRSSRSDLGLDFDAGRGGPRRRRHRAPVPRLGLYVPWADTDSIGWVRYSLDQRRIPYAYVRDEDVRAGHLREQSTCCSTATSIWSSPSRSRASQSRGGRCRSRRPPRRRAFGTPASSDDITGGLGGAGLAHLRNSSSTAACS